MPEGTLRAILRQAGIEVDAFLHDDHPSAPVLPTSRLREWGARPVARVAAGDAAATAIPREIAAAFPEARSRPDLERLLPPPDAAALARWKRHEREHAAGIDFVKGMRLLAGADFGGGGEAALYQQAVDDLGRQLRTIRDYCRGALEERIDEMLRQKRDLTERLLGPAVAGETLLTEMSDAELPEGVSLDVTRAAVE